MKRLILFDIDGTMLSTGGAAMRAFERAMVEVYGTAGPIATHSFGGKTDPQIARELLQRAGFTDAEIDRGMAALWDQYLRGLRAELARNGHRTRLLPGVHSLIEALRARTTDVVIGLLTGNIEGGATLKLASAGMDGHFRIGAYGSDHERRDQLPDIAVRRAHRLTGVSFHGKSIVVVGDTPNDVTCGRALGVHAVAVATGSFTEAQLYEAGADRVFRDLSDTDAALDALLNT
ncbi:MAG: HAD hydrolase-like protein [Gemmatimonadetes bacterium]|nr:HAD hydrolase-like protein [Gemmatimonadota bacterium]